MIKLLTCGFLLAVIFSQLLLLNKQHTQPAIYQSHKDQLLLYKMTNKVIGKQLMFNKEKHWCYIPIANSLIPSEKVSVKQEGFEMNKKYLKLLEGLCAIYRTKQFIYKLCYGEEVRQLDDEITKTNMNKPQFQNFLLGQLEPEEEQKQQQTQSQELQTIQESPYFVYIKDQIGRAPFQIHQIYHNWTQNNKNFAHISVVCKNLNDTQMSFQIMWISKHDFIILEEFKGECVAFMVKLQQNYYDKLVLNEDSINKGLNDYYRIPSNFTQALRVTNTSVDIAAPQFISENYVKINAHLRNVHFITQLDFSQIITQQLSFRQLYSQLTVKDSFLVFYGNNRIQRITITNKDPFEFSPRSKLFPDGVQAMYRIQKRQSKNITLPPLIGDNISFIRLEAGDRLKDVDSSKQCLSIESVSGRLIKLIQQDGWEYYLRSDGVSFRSRTNILNYSKQIQNQNNYYQNLTTHAFLICQGIHGANDLLDNPQQFTRLPLTGKYQIVSSDAPVSIRIFNRNNQNNKPRILSLKQYPSTGLQLYQMYQYGDQCSQNLFRSTKVIYRCGNSWFSLTHVSEKKVCSYQIIVQTRLLCPKSTSFNQEQQDNKDTVCFNQNIDTL